MANRLIVGTRRYSSWSLRGWLAVRLAGLDVEDVVVPLGEDVTPALKHVTPAGLVPVLEYDGVVIWDSLAIGEYCAEVRAELWPQDRGMRAKARSVAAEMHAGFRALRSAMPMNLGRTMQAEALAVDVASDIERIEDIWRDCLSVSSGQFLFGSSMTIPDVMFAPVVARFISYSPPLSVQAAAYCSVMRAHPLIDYWYRLADAEPLSWRLAKYE